MGLRIDFSKGDCGTRASDFFSESALMGKLEANSFPAIDNFSSSLEAHRYLCCGKDETSYERWTQSISMSSISILNIL